MEQGSEGILPSEVFYLASFVPERRMDLGINDFKQLAQKMGTIR